MAVPLLVLIVLLCYPPQALAYLDPGAGSFLVQWLIAGLIGGSVMLRAPWRKVVAILRRRSEGASATPDKKQGIDPNEH